MKKTLTLLLILTIPVTSLADLNIFTCEPEWASLAETIGGKLVKTYSATSAFVDPHYIQARPSLIAKLRRADLVICSGADLEIGWLPVLLRKANNRAVLPGSAGFFEASRFVRRYGASSSTDRSQGDVHPEGNPHVQMNPHNIAAIAIELAARMSQIDNRNAQTYDNAVTEFLQRWQLAIKRWESAAVPLRGRKIITHHKSWVYLEKWLGLEEVANLEAVPGLPPTTSHLSKLVAKFENGGADIIVRATYQDDRPSRWLQERTQISAIVLPLTVGGTDSAIDLFSLFDDIVDRLLAAVES